MHNNPYQPPAPFQATLADPLQPATESAAAANRAARIFRGLLVLYAALIGASIAASFVASSFLPPELQAYVESQANAEFASNAAMLALAVTAVSALGLLLTGWVGMFFFWRPSRWLFLAAEALFLTAMVLFGPSVMHGVEQALDSASQVVSGAILAMAFFSPVRVRFRPSNTSLARSASRGEFG